MGWRFEEADVVLMHTGHTTDIKDKYVKRARPEQMFTYFYYEQPHHYTAKGLTFFNEHIGKWRIYDHLSLSKLQTKVYPYPNPLLIARNNKSKSMSALKLLPLTGDVTAWPVEGEQLRCRYGSNLI